MTQAKTPLPSAPERLCPAKPTIAWPLEAGAFYLKSSAPWLLSSLLTLIILAFQWRFLTQAGALWCDEANSATLVAACRTPAEILPLSRCDSFPILWFLLLWGWTKVIGANDYSLRLLGFGVGCLVWASLWFAAWRLTRRPPLLSLLLLGFNPIFVRTICANRAYGLGAALLVLLFLAVWQVAEVPTRRRIAFLFLVMLAAIHTIYYNALFLACLIAAAALVCAGRQQWKTIALLPVLGALAGVTLAIYLPAFRHQQSYGVIGIEPDLPLIVQTVQGVIAAPLPVFRLLWNALIVLAIIFGRASAFWRICFLAGRLKSPLKTLDRISPRSPYAALSLLLVMGSYPQFLEVLHYGAWPRYFVVPLTLIAVCVETSLQPPRPPQLNPNSGEPEGREAQSSHIPPELGARGLPHIGLVALAAFALLPAWRGMGGRQTNVAFAAQAVTAQERPGDMVVVAPIYRGATFYRYYHGAAPWYTLPNVPTSRTGLEDVGYLAQDMRSPRSLDTLLTAVQATLTQGHRVWIVSDYDLLSPDPDVPPVPRGSALLYPDAFEVYRIYCDQQFAGLIAAHARQTEDWTNLISAPNTHGREENCDYLEAVRGWK